jgi:hypothetical protein
VSNISIGRNLELGFEQHQKTRTSHRTLVQEMTWLDNNMESLLQEPPAPTIRFVSNKSKAASSSTVAAGSPPLPPQQLARPPSPAVEAPQQQSATRNCAQMEEARSKKEAEIRKLKAGFRNELREESSDLVSTILLIKLPLNTDCPFKEQLGGIIKIELEIPAHYPLDPCQIKIVNAIHLEPWRARYVMLITDF